MHGASAFFHCETILNQTSMIIKTNDHYKIPKSNIETAAV